MRTIDSPINYQCPTCWAAPGQHCVNLSSTPATGLFHNSRRAVRMAALARLSTLQHDTLADRYVRAASDRTERRQTTFKRPQPTLFDEPSGLKAYNEQIRQAVDNLFEVRWDS